MKLIELFEKSSVKKAKDMKKPEHRNFVAKHAQRCGAGAHKSPKDYQRQPKHRNKTDD